MNFFHVPNSLPLDPMLRSTREQRVSRREQQQVLLRHVVREGQGQLAALVLQCPWLLGARSWAHLMYVMHLQLPLLAPQGLVQRHSFQQPLW